jgi:hypothetical protein
MFDLLVAVILTDGRLMSDYEVTLVNDNSTLTHLHQLLGLY